jgi:GIY-YIG catalytic domain
MMKKKITDRSKLVKKFWENKPSTEYRDALRKKDRGHGIYVLYKNDQVYYVGLSKSSLRSRIRSHATRDRHKGKWDTFSFYQIGRSKYIKDIESLLLRIIHPTGNKVKGKFHKRYDLSKRKRR